MVYGSPGIEAFVSKLVRAEQMILNEYDTKVLANLDGIAGRKILVVTDEVLMRGFDYRSNCGIELLIAAQFIHERAYEQGLGRVGRNGDKCKRYLLLDMEPVNVVQQAKLARKWIVKKWEKIFLCLNLVKLCYL